MTQLEPELYAQSFASCYGSTIGGHVRHNLDHFLCLQAGLHSGIVDYDARDRDEFLETNPEYAASKMQELKELTEMKKEGMITAEEFEKMKKRIID